jgi:hypothetical protein
VPNTSRGRPAGPVHAVDPGARRVTRTLARMDPWVRPTRWLLATVAGFMGIELVPYALWWQGAAPLWAVAGLATASGAWLGLPPAVRLARHRAVVSVADLGARSDGASVLAVACDARTRFEAAAARLDDARGWVREARHRLAETTWSIAIRAREMSRLEAALREVRTRADDTRRQTEEDRLTTALDAHRRVAEELAAELVQLADVAEGTATAIAGLGRPSVPGPELSERERVSLDSLRWFRLRLEAIDDAWVDLNAGSSPAGTEGLNFLKPPRSVSEGLARRSENRPGDA